MEVKHIMIRLWKSILANDIVSTTLKLYKLSPYFCGLNLFIYFCRNNTMVWWFSRIYLFLSCNKNLW